LPTHPTGFTTKKKIAAAVVRKVISAVRKAPSRKTASSTVKSRALKSGWPKIIAIDGQDEVVDERRHERAIVRLGPRFGPFKSLACRPSTRERL